MVALGSPQNSSATMAVASHFCVAQDFDTVADDPDGGRPVEDLLVMRAPGCAITDIDMNIGDLGSIEVPIGAVKSWCEFFGIEVQFCDPNDGYRYYFTITDAVTDLMFRTRFGLPPSGS